VGRARLIFAMSVSMFARSFAARVVLPAAPTASRWARRYSSANTAHVNSRSVIKYMSMLAILSCFSSKLPGTHRENSRHVALESDLLETSSYVVHSSMILCTGAERYITG
jgi:hypothetical protein